MEIFNRPETILVTVFLLFHQATLVYRTVYFVCCFLYTWYVVDRYSTIVAAFGNRNKWCRQQPKGNYRDKRDGIIAQICASVLTICTASVYAIYYVLGTWGNQSVCCSR